MRCKICDRSGIRTNNAKFKKHSNMCEECLRASDMYGLSDDLIFMPRFNTRYLEELLTSRSTFIVEF